MLILPDIKAGVIVADPPLAFATWSRKGEGRSPQHHYSCLSFEQLAAIPVASVAAPDCSLFLWIPLRSVFLVEPIMRAWDLPSAVSALPGLSRIAAVSAGSWAAATAPGSTWRSAGWGVADLRGESWPECGK